MGNQRVGDEKERGRNGNMSGKKEENHDRDEGRRGS